MSDDEEIIPQEVLEKLKRKESSALRHSFENKEGLNSKEYESQKRSLDISFRKKLVNFLESILENKIVKTFTALFFVGILLLMFLTLLFYLCNIINNEDKLYNVINSSIYSILLSTIGYLWGKIKA